MLQPGERAPEFTLPDHTGQDRSLTSFLGDSALVLYFYPADFTPGCTKEACDFRDLHQELVRAKLKVVGISPQDPASHARFRDKYQLPFTLLSDVDKAVIKMYQLDGPLGIGVRRGTYLIDNGRKIHSAVLADFRIGRHTAFVQEAIALRAPLTRQPGSNQ